MGHIGEPLQSYQKSYPSSRSHPDPSSRSLDKPGGLNHSRFNPNHHNSSHNNNNNDEDIDVGQAGDENIDLEGNYIFIIRSLSSKVIQKKKTLLVFCYNI